VREYMPLISIGMPVYNCEQTVAMAIRSIIQQTYPNWELLVLDDGSQDNTLQTVMSIQDSRIRVFSDSDNKGLAARLNQAVSEARGEFFARMDGDDICFPKKMECQVRFFQENSTVDLLGTGLLTFGRGGSIIGRLPMASTHERICSRPWAGIGLAHATWMGRLGWFEKNPYSSILRRAEDQELLLRTFKHSQFACLPEVLYGYRIDQLSVKKAMKERYYQSRALIAGALARGDKAIIPLAVIGQILKAAVDVFAIGTGLDYKILRHRALPIDQETQDSWRKVWTGLVTNARFSRSDQ